MIRRTLLCLLLAGGLGTVASADWVEARCDIYPKGEDHASATVKCTFGQRQGAVSITREDGVSYHLAPVENEPNLYRDAEGNEVVREQNGDLGPIFRLPEESVFVYWDTRALEPADEDNPTAPYSTADFDATTLLRCRRVGDSESEACPAGISRMQDGQASIVITGVSGAEFTINFLTDVVNATNREVEAEFEGDTWTVVIDGEEVYEVPLAAIEGG